MRVSRSPGEPVMIGAVGKGDPLTMELLETFDSMTLTQAYDL